MNASDMIRVSVDLSPEREYLKSDVYCPFMEEEHILVSTQELYVAARCLQETKIVEIKGRADNPLLVELPQHTPHFWLCFQLLGSTVWAQSDKGSLPMLYYSGCYHNEALLPYQLQDGRCWIVLVGIFGETLHALLREWPSFRGNGLVPVSVFFQKQTIKYRQRQLLEKLKNLGTGAYSLPINLSNCCLQLISAYHEEIQQKDLQIDAENLALYNRAVGYIQQHFMDEGLSRESIAENLHVSIRTLSRAFASKNIQVNGAIQLIRLYKARELLTTTDLSVEEIALRLHFYNPKYFSRVYKKLFKIPPSAEKQKPHRKP